MLTTLSMFKHYIFVFIIFNLFESIHSTLKGEILNDGFCLRKEDCEKDLYLFATNELNGMKYLLYDVSREQSISKRLSFYMVVGSLVQKLGTNWTLVLPPWSTYLPYLKAPNVLTNKEKWSDFFKIEIMRELIAVIEFNEFIEHIANELDVILILNRFNEIEQIKTDKYEFYEENCKHIQFYEKDDYIHGFFFGYKNYLKGKRLMCANFQGNNKILKNLLENELKGFHTIYIQNLNLIAQNLKDDTYWLFRRSLQLSDSVINRANKFRRKYFDSDDEKDKTFISSDWQLEKLNRQKQSSEPIGGNYLAVHWHIINDDQIDDTTQHFKTVEPLSKENQLNIEDVVGQILIGLKNANVTWTFVATNAPNQHWEAINNQFNRLIKNESKSLDKYKLFRYNNKSNKLSPVELELIEQWICAHARLFIGTSNSMYTQQIQEQREILSFKSSTTFNVLCTNQTKLCPIIELNRI